METWLLELYLPGAPDTLAARAQAGAAAVAGVRVVRTIFVPGDELCFVLFEAPSAEAVIRASERGGLRYERLVPAYQLDPEVLT